MQGKQTKVPINRLEHLNAKRSIAKLRGELHITTEHQKTKRTTKLKDKQ
jgi:hypothetical protein